MSDKHHSSNQLTLFAGDSPARTSAWRENARAWLENGRVYGSNLHELLLNLNRLGLSLKMYQDSYPQMEDEILPLSFEGWMNAGISRHGGYLTLNIGESHSAEDVSSLYQVLETDVASKFYLSPTACRGILKRAERRDKELPIELKNALESAASEITKKG